MAVQQGESPITLDVNLPGAKDIFETLGLNPSGNNLSLKVTGMQKGPGGFLQRTGPVTVAATSGDNSAEFSFDMDMGRRSLSYSPTRAMRVISRVSGFNEPVEQTIEKEGEEAKSRRVESRSMYQDLVQRTYRINDRLKNMQI